MSDNVPLEDRLGCFGYFGFGSGYALAKWGVAHDTGSLYCNRCTQGNACWQRHRRRVAELFPDLAALSAEISQTHRGEAYIREWKRRTEQTGVSFVEPFMAVMMGNMEDAGAIAGGGRAKDRGPYPQLAWPLTPLRTM